MEEKEFFKNVEIKDFKQKLTIINQLDCYRKKSGVWALLGSCINNGQWFCLQVAKTIDIGGEIASDIDCMRETTSSGTEKNYVNQFGKHKFSHNKEDFVRGIVYSEIKNNYKNLIFICVCLEDNDNKKRQTEKYFAWKTQALYWRNGRPYKNEKYYCDEHLQNVCNSQNIDDIDDKKKIDDMLKELGTIGKIFMNN